MQILIKPSDIVKRCLWRKYVDYVLEDKSEENQKSILQEDKEFYINEEDALVIDLLKVLETPHFSYRLNLLLQDLLNQRSILNKEENKYYINKKNVIKVINTFAKNFPDIYETDSKMYMDGIIILKEYSKDFIDKLNEIEITLITIKNIQMECLPISKVKKLINMFI